MYDYASVSMHLYVDIYVSVCVNCMCIVYMYLKIAEYPLLDCGAFMVAIGMVTLLYIVHSRLSSQAGHARLRTVSITSLLTMEAVRQIA